MSNNQVPDIGEMLKFWEIKDEIITELTKELCSCNDLQQEDRVSVLCRLLDKIESLGKNFNKENENGK